MSQSDVHFEGENLSVEENLKKCIISEPITEAKKKSKKKKKSNPSSTDSTGFAFSHERANLVKISISPEKGRSLIANTSMKAGTLFFSERPITTLAHNKGLCSHCNKPMVTAVPGNNISLDFEVFCTTECLQSFSLNPEKLKYFHALHSLIQESAEKHNCDADLLRIIFKIFAYYLFQDSTDALCEMLCTDSDGQLQATLFGINSLESHLSQQPSSWIDAVSNGIRAVLEGLQDKGGISFEQYDLRHLPVLVPVPTTPVCTTTGSTTTDTTATTVPPLPNTIDKLIQSILFFACIINVNAYGIVDYTGTEGSLGFGLFPTVGLCLNHSCHPNSYYTFNPLRGCMEYYTICDIKKNDELSVSYIDIFDSTIQRRENIEKLRFFRCNCTRCLGYDYIENIVHNINNSTTGSNTTTTNTNTISITSSNSNNKKKNSNKDTTTSSTLLEISPFYSVPVGCALDAWIEDEFGIGDTTTSTSSNNKAKKKGKSATSTITTSTGGSTANATAISTGVTSKSSTSSTTSSTTTTNTIEDLAKMLADAKLNAFYCETCGK